MLLSHWHQPRENLIFSIFSNDFHFNKIFLYIYLYSNISAISWQPVYNWAWSRHTMGWYYEQTHWDMMEHPIHFLKSPLSRSRGYSGLILIHIPHVDISTITKSSFLFPLKWKYIVTYKMPWSFYEISYLSFNDILYCIVTIRWRNLTLKVLTLCKWGHRLTTCHWLEWRAHGQSALGRRAQAYQSWTEHPWCEEVSLQSRNQSTGARQIQDLGTSGCLAAHKVLKLTCMIFQRNYIFLSMIHTIRVQQLRWELREVLL